MFYAQMAKHEKKTVHKSNEKYPNIENNMCDKVQNEDIKFKVTEGSNTS